MRSAVLIAPRKIEIKDTPIPEPKEREVRIKLISTGICGSDVHLFLGHRVLNKETILGHEGLGIIDALGKEVRHLQLGQRVVIEPNVPCGNCRFCNSGRGNICPNKKVLGVNCEGCFAEYVCIEADFCWLLNEEISNDEAVCIEPAAVAVHALHCSKVKPPQKIAIYGLGAIGLLLSQLAIAKGYKVYVKDLNRQKEEFAEKMGAKTLPSEENGLENFLLNEEVEAIFDCVGVASATSLIMSVAPRGSEIILVGLASNPATFVPLKIAREGISILPSIIYNHPDDFKETIDLISKQIIKPSLIISNRFPLNQFEEAITLASQGTETKVIIDIN